MRSKVAVLTVVLLLVGCISTFEVGETPGLGSISNPEEAQRAVYVVLKAADLVMTSLGERYRDGKLSEDARAEAERAMAGLLLYAGTALSAVEEWRGGGDRGKFDANYRAAIERLVEIQNVGGRP